MTFETQEEADEAYYKTHDCLSDDPDLEQSRIDRWMNDNDYEVK